MIRPGLNGDRTVSSHALGPALVAMSALLILMVSCSDGVTEPEEEQRIAAELQIIEPADAVVKDLDEALVLRATGRDGLGEPFSPELFAWSSDLQGMLGQGETITVSALESGTHWVVVQVDAGVDGVLRDSVDVVIQTPAEEFEPEIDEADVERGFIQGQLIIRYVDGSHSAGDIAAVNRKFELTGQRSIVSPNIFLAISETAVTEEEIMGLAGQLEEDPAISVAVPNGINVVTPERPDASALAFGGHEFSGYEYLEQLGVDLFGQALALRGVNKPGETVRVGSVRISV